MLDRVQSSLLRISVLASFLASFALGACGGSDGPPGKLSDALQDSFQRSCQKLFDCKSSYSAAMHDDTAFEDFAGGATVSACVNSVKTLILATNGQDIFTKLDASVSAGRIKYNATDYETCASASDKQTCDQALDQNGAMSTPPAACGTFAVGQVASAGACTIDLDCASGNDVCDATAHTCG
jgi:hypothetical protein